jgi:hypothetical protein
MSRARSLILLALVCLTTGSASAAQVLEEIVRQNYPVTANVSISLRNTDGTVHIYGTDDREIKLVAIKKAYTKERLDGIKVNVTLKDNAAAIETVFPPKPQGLSVADRSGTVDYNLFVPQTCTLSTIELSNGEVIVDGLRGEGVTVRLTNGRMLVRNCFSPTQLALGNGGIEVFYYWWELRHFPVSVEATNGDVHLAVPPDAAVRFDATTALGWIKNQFAPNTEPTGDSRQLHWTMGDDPTGEIKVRVTHGNVRIENIY